MVDKSEKFSWLVRLGYFARAVLYILLGYVALSSAQEISEGTDGVFKAVENLPGARFVAYDPVLRRARLEPLRPALGSRQRAQQQAGRSR